MISHALRMTAAASPSRVPDRVLLLSKPGVKSVAVKLTAGPYAAGKRSFLSGSMLK